MFNRKTLNEIAVGVGSLHQRIAVIDLLAHQIVDALRVRNENVYEVVLDALRSEGDRLENATAAYAAKTKRPKAKKR